MSTTTRLWLASLLQFFVLSTMDCSCFSCCVCNISVLRIRTPQDFTSKTLCFQTINVLRTPRSVKLRSSTSATFRNILRCIGTITAVLSISICVSDIKTPSISAQESSESSADTSNIDEKRVVAVLCVELVVCNGRVAPLLKLSNNISLLCYGKQNVRCHAHDKRRTPYVGYAVATRQPRLRNVKHVLTRGGGAVLFCDLRVANQMLKYREWFAKNATVTILTDDAQYCRNESRQGCLL